MNAATLTKQMAEAKRELDQLPPWMRRVLTLNKGAGMTKTIWEMLDVDPECMPKSAADVIEEAFATLHAALDYKDRKLSDALGQLAALGKTATTGKAE